jgi:hypothetical protein
MAEIRLDICTPEGKTWLAQLLPDHDDPRFDRGRSFVNGRKETSKSGRTGTAVYQVGDGVYEANEGRRRLGRSWWIVAGDNARKVSEQEALAALRS